MSITLESQEAAATADQGGRIYISRLKAKTTPVKFVLNGQGVILNAEVQATDHQDVTELADFIDTHNRTMRVRTANSL